MIRKFQDETALLLVDVQKVLMIHFTMADPKEEEITL